MTDCYTYSNIIQCRQIIRISDPMQLSSYAKCTVKGSVFVSLLAGAAYAAVSRDFRSVLHLRFYQRVYGFMVLCQSSVLFKFNGFIRLYFDFVYNINKVEI